MEQFLKKMVKVSFLVIFICILLTEILACDDCKDTSSSSSEECDCKRHPRQHKRRCETSEKKLEASTTTESPITCEKSSIDLAFLLDASGSVGIDNFNKTLTALINTVQNISVGPNDNQSHVALITFDNIAIKHFGLLDHLSTASVQNAISKTPYASFGTFIEGGMVMAVDEVFGQSGNRANSPDIMIVITDGHDKSNVTGAQRLAASKNITVFSVGIGSDVYYHQLLAISGSIDRTYNITTFEFLGGILKDICHNLGAGSNKNDSISDSLSNFDKIQVEEAPHASCDYETSIQNIEDLTREEFCLVRPYCYKIC